MVNEVKLALPKLYFIVFIFNILVLILLLIGAVIVLSKAEIILQVKGEPFIGEFEIKIVQSLKKPLYNLNVISGSIYNLNELQQKKNLTDYLKFNYSQNNQEKIILVSRYHLEDFLNQKLINLNPVPKRVINQSIQLLDFKIKNFDSENNQATLNLSLKAEAIPDYDTNFLKEFLCNKSKDSAIHYLRSLPNVQEVKIKIWPSFLDKLPFLSKKIKIRIELVEKN